MGAIEWDHGTANRHKRNQKFSDQEIDTHANKVSSNREKMQGNQNTQHSKKKCLD